MPANRPPVVNQIIEIWNRLTWSQRGTIFLFSFLGLALIGSLVYFMQRVQYNTLFENLSSEDAKVVAQKLNDEKKDFTSTENADGITIKVAAPDSEIGKMQIEYKGEGLAGSGRLGFTLFDKNQFGMTDFTEKVNLQRALQDELEWSIERLEEIREAHVHISLAKDSIYDQDKKDATAVVIVTLKRSAELSKTQIAGIKAIVKGAVESLSLRNISVVDNQGKLLTPLVDSGEEEENVLESTYRGQQEKEITDRVLSMLETMVGQGKVHVVTALDMDFNTTEQMEEQYNPNPQAVLSQHKTQERTGPGNSVVSSGVPGTESNLSENAVTSSIGTVQERIRQSESTNYEVSKLVRHTVQPKGTIRKISVAVALDYKTIYKQSGSGEVTTTQEPLSPQLLESCRNVVQGAIGFNEVRGDRVTIENYPFYTDTKPLEPQAEEPFYVHWQVYLIPGMKYLAFIVLFLLVYLIFLRPMRRRVSHALSMAVQETGQATASQLPGGEQSHALPEGENAGQLEAHSTEAQDKQALHPAKELQEDLLSIEATDEQIERELMKEANMVDMGGRKYTAMKNKLIEKAKKDPEMVSQLIRTVLRERI